MPSVITVQQALGNEALCYTDRQLSVASTYVHSQAETPVVQFVVDMFFREQIHNRSSTN